MLCGTCICRIIDGVCDHKGVFLFGGIKVIQRWRRIIVVFVVDVVVVKQTRNDCPTTTASINTNTNSASSIGVIAFLLNGAVSICGLVCLTLLGVSQCLQF